MSKLVPLAIYQQYEMDTCRDVKVLYQNLSCCVAPSAPSRTAIALPGTVKTIQSGRRLTELSGSSVNLEVTKFGKIEDPIADIKYANILTVQLTAKNDK